MKASTRRRAHGVNSPARLPAPRREWAYFFDIDGTLVDIAPSPSEIFLEHELHRLIRRLHWSSGGALALISGRSIVDVDSIFIGSRLPVAGQHGLERRNARGTVSRNDDISNQLAEARRRLGEVTARHSGLLLEDKGLSLALHYRAAPALASFAHRTMRDLHADIGPDYTILSGKRVVELTRSGKDKGEAVREFMEEEPFRGRIPVFVGDDGTDEHGFRVVNARRGHSIKVGGGQTSARWRLRDVEAVRSWLERGEDEQVRAPDVTSTENR